VRGQISATDPGDAEDGDDEEAAIVPIGDEELAIARPMLDDLASQLAYRGREEAGLLFGAPGMKLATFFVRDKAGEKTASSFTLHTPPLNATIRRAKPWNLHLLAVVHSHPDGVWRPSAGDIHYVRQLFAHPRNDTAQRLFMPLLVNGLLIPYLLYRDEPDRVVRTQLKIVG